MVCRVLAVFHRWIRLADAADTRSRLPMDNDKVIVIVIVIVLVIVSCRHAIRDNYY